MSPSSVTHTVECKLGSYDYINHVVINYFSVSERITSSNEGIEACCLPPALSLRSQRFNAAGQAAQSTMSRPSWDHFIIPSPLMASGVHFLTDVKSITQFGC